MADFFTTMILPSPVQGDTPTYLFNVTLEAGRSLAKAWMTAKNNVSDADPGVFQVSVTSFGTVTTNGDGSTTTQVFFKLTSVQSAAIPVSTISGDVQCKLDNGDLITPVIFSVKSQPQYTQATV